jgi:hypothetical protein
MQIKSRAAAAQVAVPPVGYINASGPLMQGLLIIITMYSKSLLHILQE